MPVKSGPQLLPTHEITTSYESSTIHAMTELWGNLALYRQKRLNNMLEWIAEPRLTGIGKRSQSRNTSVRRKILFDRVEALPYNAPFNCESS